MGKGQLSVMIIIGLVVLIVVGLGWFIFTSQDEARSRVTTTKTEVSRDLVGTVEQFMIGCLRIAAKESLETLGAQGGVLYVKDGGLARNEEAQDGLNTLTYEGRPVAYGLYAPVGIVTDGAPVPSTLFSSVPADYPWPTFPEVYSMAVPPVLTAVTYRGYFGTMAISPLDGPAPRTMEKQLRKAVATKVDTCLDWSKLAHMPLDIVSAPASVNVSITDDDVSFTLNTSIVVTLKDGSGESRLALSTLRVPVRLRKVVMAARTALDADGTDSTFAIQDFATDGITVTVTRDIPRRDGAVGHDLITFTDAQSSLDGASYQFRTMRQNRYPALLYVTAPAVAATNLCNGAIITRTGGLTDDHLQFNTDVCEGGSTASLRLPPAATAPLSPVSRFGFVDADEDAVTLEITVDGNALRTDVPRVYAATPGLDAVVEFRAYENDNPAFEDTQRVLVPVRRNAESAALVDPVDPDETGVA